jgi:hypothetical protein
MAEEDCNANTPNQQGFDRLVMLVTSVQHVVGVEILQSFKCLNQVDPNEPFIDILAAVAVALNLLLEVLPPAELQDHDELCALCQQDSNHKTKNSKAAFMDSHSSNGNTAPSEVQVDMIIPIHASNVFTIRGWSSLERS